VRAACLVRRDDRDHDVCVGDDRVEIRQKLESGLLREPPRAHAAAGDRRNGAVTAGAVRSADRTPHRTGADDSDRPHEQTIRKRRYAVGARP
jgi:hypothetical protein